MNIRRLPIRLRNNIIIVAGRAFAVGAYTPVLIPETVSVHFAIPSEVGKHLKSVLKK
jgi:hypothetical protein